MEAGKQLLANVSEPTTATRADVAGYLLSLTERGCKPATVSVRFRALQQFFKWLVEERERQDDPMAGMRPAKVSEVPVEVLSVADVRRLLAVCAGTDLVSRRDTAILRLFADTGMRREELANLRVDDLYLDEQVAYVMGKGRRPRACPFGNKTALALDRYLRVRSKHANAESEWLWLGHKGRLTASGIGLMVRRRGQQAGVSVHPHQLRHNFAHVWLSSGGNEGTSCDWLAGVLGRCWTATAVQQPTNERERRTGGCRWATGSKSLVTRL